MNVAIQQPAMPLLARLDHAVRFIARTTAMVAAMMISITWLLLMLPLAIAVMPSPQGLPADWWWPTLLGVVCVANAIAGGYFYGTVLKRRLPLLLPVVVGYFLLMASEIGVDIFNRQLFVALATLHVLIGSAVAEWLAHRYASRVEAAIESWPQSGRWLVRTVNFWSVFLIGYLALGIAIHDLMACQLGVERFLF